jgi:ketosteroid isomerase-like protein
VPEHRDSPDAVALRFVDCINRGDVDGLAALMTDDHEVRTFDEPPLIGRSSVAEAWRDYANASPRYRIYPRRVAVQGNRVAILGHTTGSHLDLPDEEESQETLIWLARVADDRVASWTLVEDTPERRRELSLEI